ncbi:hypothetical protein ACR3K2_34540 [Cryptosporidium serpentis]
MFRDYMGFLSFAKSSSIEPGLYENNALISLNKSKLLFDRFILSLSQIVNRDIYFISPNRKNFKKSDLVAFYSPVINETKLYYELLIKRIIALSDDIVHLDSGLSIIVPKGHCWVEDNNGSNFEDSRFFGAIPLGIIRGVVTHTIWPLKRFTRLYTN